MTEKSFKDIQKLWYDKLKDSGFDDIEDKKRYLKKWDSFKIRLIETRKQNQYPEYQSKIDSYRNHPEFFTVCDYLAKHGNSKFNMLDIETVWDLHVHGLTIRKIAKHMKRSKSRIFEVIKKIKEWMELC